MKDPVVTMTVSKRPSDSTSPLGRSATTRQAVVDAFFRVGKDAGLSTTYPSTAFKDWHPSATIVTTATTASATIYSLADESDENVPNAFTLAFTDTEDDYVFVSEEQGVGKGKNKASASSKDKMPRHHHETILEDSKEPSTQEPRAENPTAQ
ncbi:hypothetical protein BGX27_004223 [Mortierella sp. AM989]|nr:hypothetical protein BGX27_004223 [Mortierella sp. AM989]